MFTYAIFSLLWVIPFFQKGWWAILKTVNFYLPNLTFTPAQKYFFDNEENEENKENKENTLKFIKLTPPDEKSK